MVQAHFDPSGTTYGFLLAQGYSSELALAIKYDVAAGTQTSVSQTDIDDFLSMEIGITNTKVVIVPRLRWLDKTVFTGPFRNFGADLNAWSFKFLTCLPSDICYAMNTMSFSPFTTRVTSIDTSSTGSYAGTELMPGLNDLDLTLLKYLPTVNSLVACTGVTCSVASQTDGFTATTSINLLLLPTSTLESTDQFSDASRDLLLVATRFSATHRSLLVYEFTLLSTTVTVTLTGDGYWTPNYAPTITGFPTDMPISGARFVGGPTYLVAAGKNSPWIYFYESQTCHANCQTCNGPALNNCFTCVDGTTLSNGVCLSCAKGCKTCAPGNLLSCASCQTGFYLLVKPSLARTVCDPCFASDLKITSPTTCDYCQQYCTSCNAATGLCNSCIAGTYLTPDQTACVLDCGNTFTNYVEAVTRHCKSCNSDCQKCIPPRFIGDFPECLQCTTSVPPGFYNMTTGICEANFTGNYIATGTARKNFCEAPCVGCLYNPYNCTSCNDPALTLDTFKMKCLMFTCGPGYYLSGSECAPCDPACLTCSINATNCLTCPVNWYRRSDTGICVNVAIGVPAMYLHPIDLVYYPCDLNCANCITNAQKCTTCPVVGQYPRETDFVCAPCNIDAGYFVFRGLCKQCDSSCASCVSTPTNCIGCAAGFVPMMHLGICVPDTDCGLGYLLAKPATYNQCTPCSGNCAACSTYTYLCTQCFANMYVDVSSSAKPCITCQGSYYINSAALTCHACTSTCASGACSKAGTNCTNCQASYGVLDTNRQCRICSPSTNGILTARGCKVCDPQCATCGTYTSSCLTCPAGSFRSATNGTCTTTCTNGYYVSGTTCIKCDPNCVTCTTNAQTCTSCQLGYNVKNLGATAPCVLCNGNQFVNPADSQCYDCDPSCASCYGTATNCTSCTNSATTWLSTSNSSCVACGDGFFSSATKCLPCPNGCASCNPTDPFVCLTCLPTFYLSVENSTCTVCQGNNYVTATMTCDKCGPTCKTCANSPNQCTSCYPGLYLDSANFLCAPCPPGKYPDLATNICYPCDANCATCASSATTCTSCVGANNYLHVDTKVCADCVAPGKVLGNDNKCYPCDSNCQTCSVNPRTCVNCPATNYLLPNKTCTTCPGGFVVTGGTNCQQCQFPCIGCTTAPQGCNNCLPGYNLNAPDCLNACPLGQYKDPVTTVCTPCAPECAECTGNPYNCTACYSGWKPHKILGYCVDCSLPGWMTDSRGMCIKCDKECATCSTNPSICDSCASGLYLFANSSCRACVGAFYVDGGNCLPCDSNCKTCTVASTNCSTCYLGLNLRSGSTSCQVCSTGWYVLPADNICYQCDPNCVACANSPTFCTACSGGTYLSVSNNTCGGCGDGYTLGFDSRCYQCNPTCQTCSNNSDRCVTCAAGLYLNSDKSTCEPCSSGSFVTGSNTCAKCNTECGTCTGTATNCLTCGLKAYKVFDTVLGTWKCDLALPSQPFYLNSADQVFYLCSANCSSCFGNANTCTSCPSTPVSPNGMTYISGANQTCDWCGVGYSISIVDNKCYQCLNPACDTCVPGSNRCLSCVDPNTYLSVLNDTCSPCGDGFLVVSGVCQPCDPMCETCSGTPSECVICQNPDHKIFMPSKSCVDCVGPRFMDPLDGLCYSCNTTICKTCVGTANNCSECAFSFTRDSILYTNNFISTQNQTCYPAVGPFYPMRSYGYPCSTNCTECNTTSCTMCPAGQYFSTINGTCDTCGQGFGINGLRCERCQASCATCSVSESCLTCPPGKYLMMMYTNPTCGSCAGNYYIEPNTINCRLCSVNCTGCVGSAENCTSCSGGSYFRSIQNGSCTTCGDGYYTYNGYCYPCDASCKTCVDSPRKCLLCSDPSKHSYQSINFTCEVCPISSGWFVDTSDAANPFCARCNPKCNACQGNENYCVTCFEGYHITNDWDHTCSNLVKGYYRNTTNNLAYRCEQNPANCTSCYGRASNCTACPVGVPFVGTNACHAHALGCYGNNYTWIDNKCYECDLNCTNCTGHARSCTVCPPGHFIDQYTKACIPACSPYRTIWGASCLYCPLDCLTCNSAGTCLTCPLGYTLSAGRCTNTCPLGFFNDSTAVCQPCDTGCTTCKDMPTTCTSCKPGFFVDALDFKCVTCGTGYFVAANMMCYPCDVNCKTCEGNPFSCTSCSPGNYLNATGLTGCTPCNQPGFYVTSAGRCQNCEKGCYLCQANTGICSECKPGWYFDYQGKCDYLERVPNTFLNVTSGLIELCDINCASCKYTKDNCTSCYPSQGQYLNVSTNQCQFLTNQMAHSGSDYASFCDSECKECIPEDRFSCTECYPGKTLFYLGTTGRCLDSCEPGNYMVPNGTCIACLPGCATCESLTGRCLSCKQNYYFSWKVDVCVDCGDYNYINSTDQKCYPCHPNCRTCLDNSPTSCLSCDAPYALFYNNLTCGFCPTQNGMFVSALNECWNCSTNCSTCVTFAQQCTTCPVGYMVSLVNNTCIPDCGLGFYKTYQGKCQACNSNCSVCTDGTGRCTVCRDGLTLNQEGFCVDCSQPGMWLNYADNRCYHCSPNCYTCTLNETYCTSCLGTYLLQDNTCGPCNMQTGKIVISGKYCGACDSNCANCFGNPWTCISCPAGSILHKGSSRCVSACPPQTYRSISGECVSCPADCLTCTDLTGRCTSCISPLTPTGFGASRCLNCRDGYYINPTDSYCYPCNSNCQECFGLDTNCTSCSSKLFLLIPDQVCVVCGPGYLKSGSNCLRCNSTCRSCTTDTSRCTSCDSPYQLFEPIQLCPDPRPSRLYYVDKITYPTCDSNCESFVSQPQYCTKCAPNLVLSSVNLTCGSCGDGYYKSNLDQICYMCDANCLTCSGTPTNCTSCGIDLKVSSTNGTCAVCGDGFTVIAATGTCTPCHPDCLTCYEASDQCLTCRTGFHLSATNFTCTPCGDGFILNVTNGLCYPCNSNCKTCAGTDKTCTSCDPVIGNLFPSNSTCGPCNFGWFVDFLTHCRACVAPCVGCTGISTNCTACASPNLITLPGNSCTDCTTNPLYQISASGLQCLRCLPTCQKCDMIPENCTTCFPGSLLVKDPSNPLGVCSTNCTKPGFYSDGINCQPCAPNCLSCSGDPTNCTSCASGQYVRRDQNNICSSTCPSGLFVTISGASSFCDLCSSNCSTCTGSASSCTDCGSGLSLVNSACYVCPDPLCQTCNNPTKLCQTCYPGFTFHPTQQKCVTECSPGFFGLGGTDCSLCDSVCQECSGSAQACTKCAGGKYLYPNKTCSSCDKDGWFIDGSLCKECHKTCLRCTINGYDKCDSCLPGWTFKNGECHDVEGNPVYLNMTNSTSPPMTYDMVYDLAIEPGGLGRQEEKDPQFWNKIYEVVKVEMEAVPLTDESNEKIQLRFDFYVNRRIPIITLYFSFGESPVASLYLITVKSWSTASFLHFENSKYRVGLRESNTTWRNTLSASAMKSAGQQGELVGTLIGGGDNPTVATSLVIMMTIMSADPTGVTSKFSQVIKINSKLLYLNTNYGPKLRRFLETADKAAGAMKEDSYRITQVKSNAYRGRLSQYKLLVEAQDKLMWKVVLYMASWALRILGIYLVWKQPEVGKGLLILMYMIPKIHLIVFNMVIADFFLYFTRTSIHSKDLKNRVVAQVVLLLLSADLCVIFDLVWRDEPWRAVFNKMARDKRECDFLENLAKKIDNLENGIEKPSEAGVDVTVEETDKIARIEKEMREEREKKKSLKVEEQEDQDEKDKQEIKKMKEEIEKESQMVIDYLRTYKEIDYNMHLMVVMANHLKLSRIVFLSLGCRANFLMHTLRLCIYQMLVIVNQYFVRPCVGILIVMELSRVIVTSALYAKKKHYKQVLLFLLDVSQSVFLCVFLCFAYMYIERDLQNNPIPEQQENMTIYLVIGATLVEYALTFMYLTIQMCKELHHYFLTRKVRKYKKNYPMTDFIKSIHPDELAARNKRLAEQKAFQDIDETNKGLQESQFLQQNSLDGVEKLGDTGLPKTDKHNRILAQPMHQLGRKGPGLMRAIGEKKSRIVTSGFVGAGESVPSIKLADDSANNIAQNPEPREYSAPIVSGSVAAGISNAGYPQTLHSSLVKTKNDMTSWTPVADSQQHGQTGSHVPTPQVYQKKFGITKPGYSHVNLASLSHNKMGTINNPVSNPNTLQIPQNTENLTSDSFRGARNFRPVADTFQTGIGFQPEDNRQKKKGKAGVGANQENSVSDWDIKQRSPTGEVAPELHHPPTRVTDYEAGYDYGNAKGPQTSAKFKKEGSSNKYGQLQISIPENKSSTSPPKTPQSANPLKILPQDTAVEGHIPPAMDSPSRQQQKLIAAFGGTPTGRFKSAKGGSVDDDIVQPVTHLLKEVEQQHIAHLKRTSEDKHVSGLGAANLAQKPNQAHLSGALAQFSNEMQYAGLRGLH